VRPPARPRTFSSDKSPIREQSSLSPILGQLTGAGTSREWKNQGGMLVLLVSLAQGILRLVASQAIPMSQAQDFANGRIRTPLQRRQGSDPYTTGCQGFCF